MSENQSEIEQQWRERISSQEKSGQSIAAFCREHELRAWQFYEWKKRFRQNEAASFVAVSVKGEDEWVSPPPAPSLSSIELRHRRGWSMQIEAGFDADHLRRVLSVLDAAS
jgi:hypothetical protein